MSYYNSSWGDSMLKIYFGTLEKEVRSASQYFDVNYKTEWMNNKLNREMILDVDKSEVVADNFIQSSVLSAIPHNGYLVELKH